MGSLDRWVGRLLRALSLRVIVVAFFGGVGIGVLANMLLHVPTMPAVWVSAGLLYLVAVFNDGQMMRCDQCGKRVKLGYSACHHCGYVRA